MWAAVHQHMPAVILDDSFIPAAFVHQISISV